MSKEQAPQMVRDRDPSIDWPRQITISIPLDIELYERVRDAALERNLPIEKVAKQAFQNWVAPE